MKTFLAILAATLVTASTALAHEAHEHAAGSGLFGLPPEYVHVLLNPLPVYGAAIGVLVLGIPLLARSKAAQTAGLWLVIISTALAWPVAHYGQNAYKGIREKADEPGQDSLDEHMERAERTIYVFYGTAVLGLVALVARKKFPKAATPLTIVTLVAGMASLGAGGWISKAGGQIRHPEFRSASASSTSAAPHEHGKSKHAHEKTKPADASDGHKHGTTAEQPGEKTPLPDNLEGVWKAIHEHHGELESAVNGKKFSDVRSHAGMINDLAKRLVKVSQPDQKPVAESGVTKINHALDELKQSAETGSELVMKNNFKEFEKALNELEQQMKKQ